MPSRVIQALALHCIVSSAPWKCWWTFARHCNKKLNVPMPTMRMNNKTPKRSWKKMKRKQRTHEPSWMSQGWMRTTRKTMGGNKEDDDVKD